MISAEQLTQIRETAHREIAETFPTTITIGDHADIPAARWSSARAGQNGPLGTMLPTVDITIRVARSELTNRGITIIEEKTVFTEGGRKYRVERTRSALGDPGLVLEGKTA